MTAFTSAATTSRLSAREVTVTSGCDPASRITRSWLRNSDATTALMASNDGRPESVRRESDTRGRPVDTRSTPLTFGSRPRRSPMCPAADLRSGQRQPGARSAPKTRSSPPPVASNSAAATRRSCLAARWARPAATVVAPTPPLPPITLNTTGGSSGSSSMPANSELTKPVCSGSTMTGASSGTDHDISTFASGPHRWTFRRGGKPSPATVGA